MITNILNDYFTSPEFLTELNFLDDTLNQSQHKPLHIKNEIYLESRTDILKRYSNNPQYYPLDYVSFEVLNNMFKEVKYDNTDTYRSA